MYNERTHTTREVVIPGADDSTIYDGAELEDATMAAMEQFALAVKDKPDWRPMPIDQQHELAPHLRSIEESKRRRKETSNPRYIPGLGGLNYA